MTTVNEFLYCFLLFDHHSIENVSCVSYGKIDTRIFMVTSRKRVIVKYQQTPKNSKDK